MQDIDIVHMLGNLSQSLQQVNHLIGGASYIVGIGLLIGGILKLKQIAAAGHFSQEKKTTAFAYILGGLVLLYLPSGIILLSRSTFGGYNVLQYANANPFNLYQSILVILNACGLIWFIRGCIIITQTSKPGHQSGAKGFFYLIAGILSMNFGLTMRTLNFVVGQLVNLSLTVKSIVGY